MNPVVKKTFMCNVCAGMNQNGLSALCSRANRHIQELMVYNKLYSIHGYAYSAKKNCADWPAQLQGFRQYSNFRHSCR